MVENFPNQIPASVLRRWMLRAALLGFAVGVWAGIAALLN